MSESGASMRLAVLIDADNVGPERVVALLTGRIGEFGVATIKRAYGDWTDPRLTSWKDVLLHHAIQPMQQFANKKGKNATDSAMIIDAMDLLYTRKLDGFCIVSSDSDFTALARRIREEGLFVLGVGEAKTHASLRAACSLFIETESGKSGPAGATTRAAPAPKPKKTASPPPPKSDSGRKPKQAPQHADPILAEAIRSELKALRGDSEGWVSLGLLGKALAGNADYKHHSQNRGGLKKIIAASPDAFEIRTRGGAEYIRARAPS